MIFLNFKTYPEASGGNAKTLAKIAAEVSQESGIPVVVAAQFDDIAGVAKIPGISIWGQYVDIQRFLPESAKKAGAKGTFLNHSEHRVSYGTLQAIIEKCREVGLETLVFAGSVDEAKKIIRLSPDWIAYEPPELIASPDTSVARAKPDVIKVVADIIPQNIKLAVGAGIKDRQDVEVSLSLGAKGVALSSAFVLSPNPKAVLLEIAEGFK